MEKNLPPALPVPSGEPAGKLVPIMIVRPVELVSNPNRTRDPGEFRGIYEDVYEKLPTGVRASAPSEVKSVAFVELLERQVGRYSGGTPAIRITADVQVVDATSGKLLASKSFTGPPPANLLGPGSYDNGVAPVDEIARYLSSLR